ncbi:type II toxin-antitoxin system RelE/ParE family toxin [Cyanobium sp. ULC082]
MRRFGSIARTAFCKLAFRKLAILDAAACLNDLQIPPGNRLEPLRGNRHGQHHDAALLGNRQGDDAVREAPDQGSAGAVVARGAGLRVLRMRRRARRT